MQAGLTVGADLCSCVQAPGSQHLGVFLKRWNCTSLEAPIPSLPSCLSPKAGTARTSVCCMHRALPSALAGTGGKRGSLERNACL